MDSIAEDFKTWENNSDGSCELFDELGKSLAKFHGEFTEIGGYLYVYQNNKFYDVVFNNDKLDLQVHTGLFPTLIRKKIE